MTTPLKAVNSNNVASVRELIAHGVDVNEPDAAGDAPLVMAAYNGYTEIVRLLLEAGADVSAVDPQMKATALHAAAYAGRTAAAKLLIAHHIDIDKQGPYNGYTALHDAVWQNHIETAEALIEAGATCTSRPRQARHRWIWHDPGISGSWPRCWNASWRPGRRKPQSSRKFPSALSIR